MARFHRRRGQGIEGKSRPVPPLGKPASLQDDLDLSPSELLELEHDLISRVMQVLQRRSAGIGQGRSPDPVLLATVADFVTTYAGRVHHGKEEEILFRELNDEDLSSGERRLMEELVRDHVKMRSLSSDLDEQVAILRKEEEGAMQAVVEAMDGLADIYAPHMETEEQEFFPAAMDHLDDSSAREVLERMRHHDRGVVHEKYGSVAEQLEARTEDWVLTE